ncbi:DsrE family protein [Desulfoferrobacter suflitae]|uniref:DsrE family protein n=1 Tax=Desulfoferrobacter suflitae TaxID=2865782 RepID=UPI0021645AA0|nr:DsrE family protein [Desulfoferrobacter suflitae]MCK8600247.1 DsrE family protein [Desulfoferrobacter suflitae]
MANTRIVIHISDRDKWVSLLNELSSLKVLDQGECFEVIVVADIFAGAVCVACNKSLREQMAEFVNSGHSIVVCEESLRCLNIRVDSLPEFVQPVPNGLAELIKRQKEGFLYMKI